MSALAPVVTAELKRILSRLKLGQMSDTLPERLVTARASSMPHVDFLRGTFSEHISLLLD